MNTRTRRVTMGSLLVSNLAWSATHRNTDKGLDWHSGGWGYEGDGYWFEGLTR